jgi:hypothetical protein
VSAVSAVAGHVVKQLVSRLNVQIGGMAIFVRDLTPGPPDMSAPVRYLLEARVSD